MVPASSHDKKGEVVIMDLVVYANNGYSAGRRGGGKLAAYLETNGTYGFRGQHGLRGGFARSRDRRWSESCCNQNAEEMACGGGFRVATGQDLVAIGMMRRWQEVENPKSAKIPTLAPASGRD